ncbi:MAG: Asp-tRNA(Asn)/Glu-tRNA(Gln) amidotransferase subunit GatB [Patescibacteria group bacterium]
MKYEPTIGLEIHAHLKTRTKMFCSCPNSFDENHPNTNVCPICLGHPGTLPTINQEAVLAVVKLGLALRGTIADQTHFDRKSYFYPDLPKGYQISQYEHPLVEGGVLNGVHIRRIHLEEDAGRLIHETNNKKQATSLVDFNRAGTPLIELVTEPDIKTAEEAVKFAKELQLILRCLEVSDANMEKGQMRVEANISLNMGVKVEVKNINSFKAVHDAIEYELKRQEELLEGGKKVVQETMGWDEAKKITESQRTKESAHDYRYFPEPDLPPLDLKDWDFEDMRRHLPELPSAKRERFAKEYGLDPQKIEILVEDKDLAEYFEETASELKSKLPTTDYQLLTNYLLSDLKGLMQQKEISFGDLKINPEEFAHLITLTSEGKLSSRLAKDLMLKMLDSGEDPETIMKSESINLIDNVEELAKIIREIIGKNPRAVTDYKKGKSEALQFLLGQVMAKTKGQADPEIAQKILAEDLKNF